MRINLRIEEVSVLRNALATRHDDLKDLVGQWTEQAEMANSEPLRDAQSELELVRELDAKLAGL